MSKIRQKNYSIAHKSLEEVVEQVRFILSYDGIISKIVITNGNILVEYVVEDTEPPYGKLPDSPTEVMSDVLRKINLEPVEHNNEMSIDSLSVIASALIQARKSLSSALAWVVSDHKEFRKWLGVEKTVWKLLDIPVYEVDTDSLPKDKLVLICGRIHLISPLEGKSGIIIDMGGSI